MDKPGLVLPGGAALLRSPSRDRVRVRNAFWRLRIGIGHPRDTAASEQEVVAYVLHPPRPDEQPLIEDAIARGLDVWPLLAAGDAQAAMLRLHTKSG